MNDATSPWVSEFVHERLTAFLHWFFGLSLGGQALVVVGGALLLYGLAITRCPRCVIGTTLHRINRRNGGTFEG